MTNKAFIFDMDGVIFDTERLWKTAFETANRQFLLPLSEADRQKTCGKSEEQIRTELKAQFPTIDANAYRDTMLAFVHAAVASGDFEIKPGFESLVATLKERGAKLALATSSRRERAEKMFRQKSMDLHGIFDATVFSEDVGGRAKPDPAIFLLAAERLGKKAADCYVIEDSLNGIEAAVNGGFMPIMAVDLTPPNAFCRRNALMIANNLSEIEGSVICE